MLQEEPNLDIPGGEGVCCCSNGKQSSYNEQTMPIFHRKAKMAEIVMRPEVMEPNCGFKRRWVN